MRTETETITKGIVITCDLCSAVVRNRYCCDCEACKGDFCEGCLNSLPAGIYDGQVRRVCDTCVEVYHDGLTGVCKDVAGIRLKLDKEIQAKRDAAQKLIDDIFADIRERVGTSQ